MDLDLDQTIQQVLDEAERDRRFAAPSAGSQRRAFEALAKAGTLGEPYPGVFARSGVLAALSRRDRALHLIRTLARLHPAWTFCSYSAALLHGLQVPYTLLDRPHVGVRPGCNRTVRLKSVAFHIVKDDEPVEFDGIRATSLPRTLFDCMRQSSFRHGLAIVDSALHHRLIGKRALARYLDARGRYRHGTAAARTTLHYADGRSANGGESIVRAIMIERGFQIPELQVEIEDPMRPGAVFEVDFYWRLPNGHVVIGELDGMVKYRVNTAGAPVTAAETQRRLVAERKRESHINLTGATVVRFTYEEACDEDYLERILVRAGVPLVSAADNG